MIMNIKDLLLLNPESLLLIRENLDDLKPEEQQSLLEKVYSPGDLQQRVANVHFVLVLMHDAYQKNKKVFLEDIFFPWVEIQNKTKKNKSRIFNELSRLDEFTQDSLDDVIHIANIYRNIVSDLLDPYLTLIVSCYQLIEGSFTDINNANLGQAERNKYEFIISRIKPKNNELHLLYGYNPLVRNAISHLGSHGLLYKNGVITFRNIQRGSTLKVQAVRWSTREFNQHNLSLLECILSIDIAIEIFGLDISDLVAQDSETMFKFILHVLSGDQRSEIRLHQYEIFNKLRNSNQISEEEKLNVLSKLLFYNCGIRDMEIKQISFNNSQKAIILGIPVDYIDVNNDEQLISRCAEIPRYAILARSIFSNMYDTFLVEENDEVSKDTRISAIFQGQLLDEYIDEKAGLVDLLHNSAFFLAGNRIGIGVNFDNLEQLELESIQDPFPRKRN